MNKNITKSAATLIGSLIGLQLMKKSNNPTTRISSMLIGGFVGGFAADELIKITKK